MEVQQEIFVYPSPARKKLRYAKDTGQPVYICAMSGFGKSALVRHWLRRQKYTLIDAEHAGPEALEIELPSEPPAKPRIVVIDNLQFGESGLLAEGLNALLRRRDLWVILISRAICPDYLISYKLKGPGFIEITQEDLALSEEEAAELLEKRGISPEPEAMRSICRDSRGHGLTLKITADIIEQERILSRNIPARLPDITEKAHRVLWDYLNRDIYDRWEPYLTESICKLSIVDSFSKELAEAITGNAQVELLLKKAIEIGSFLSVRDGLFRLDPEVLVSMRRRLEMSYTGPQRDELYAAAARWYLRNGQTKQALELYKITGNTGQIVEILKDLARKHPGMTALYEYKQYYLELPEADIAGSLELMLGASMLHSLTLDIEKSEYWYERLKQTVSLSSGSMKRTGNSYLAYLDLALPHRGSRDAISIITSLSKLAAAREISLSEFSVTGNSMSNMNGGKDFCEWSRHDNELASKIGGAVSFVLGKHGAGLIDLALAESYLEKGRDDYEIIRLASRGVMQAESGKIEERMVGESIMARLHLRKGHIEDARDIMRHLAEQCEREGAVWLLPNLRAFLCQFDLYSGNTWHYTEWMKNEAPPEGSQFIITERYRYLTKIRIYMVQGRYEQAYALLERMRYYAELYGRTYIRMECGFLLAILQYRTANEDWRATLQEAYAQAEDYHFVRLITREAGALLELFEKAELEIKDPRFHEQVMRELRDMARFYPAYLRENTGTEEFSESALRVLRLQAAGTPNEKIAAQLGISVSTVKYHCRENYAKLGVKNRSAAVAEAQKRKLI